MLELGSTWATDPAHFDTRYWSILWESLLDADWSGTGDSDTRLDALIALGRRWLLSHEHLPDWNYVWQRLLRNRERLPEGALNVLLLQGWRWGDRGRDLPGWAHVWERLVERRAELPPTVPWDDLMRRGHGWLEGREDAPEWSYVWQYLLNHAGALPEDIDRDDLYRRGDRWLDGREDAPQWAFVWRFLLDHADALPRDINRDDLYRRGDRWLDGREDAPEWSHVWQFLLSNTESLPNDIDREELYQLGRNWLEGREVSAEWNYVWCALLDHQHARTGSGEKEALYGLGISWLKGGEGLPGWDVVFERLLDNGIADDALLSSATHWISKHQNAAQAPILAHKLLLRWTPGVNWAEPCANILADWLSEHGRKRAGGAVLHGMLKRGTTRHLTHPPETAGPGWNQLCQVVSELTAAPRAFIESHAVGDTVTGTVTAPAKRGYLMRLDDAGEVMAFLPGSQWDTSRPTDWDAPIGQTCAVQIVKIDADSLWIVVSRRALIEHKDAVSSDEAIAALSIGQVINGTIENIIDYGLFVDVGGINGLLHESNLIDRGADSMRSRYAEGDRLRVRILKIEVDRQRITLEEYQDPTERQAREAERQHRLESLNAGQVCDGVIANIVDYGLFVDLGGVHGLLHHTKLLDQEHHGLKDRYGKGAPIRVEIIDIDVERGRVGLAECPPDAAEYDASDHHTHDAPD